MFTYTGRPAPIADTPNAGRGLDIVVDDANTGTRNLTGNQLLEGGELLVARNPTTAGMTLDNGANITFNSRPLGNWDNATAYVANDAVFHNDFWWVANAANTNSEPVRGSADWNIRLINHEVILHHEASQANHPGRGAQAWIWSEEAQQLGSFQAFNCTIKTGGGFVFHHNGTGNTLCPFRMDEVVLWNTNPDRSPYFRVTGNITNAPAGSYIGHLLLDGDARAFGVYYQGTLTGDLRPDRTTLRNGFLVGHAGGDTTDSYSLIPNLDATQNLSRDYDGNANKFDIAAANGAGANFDDLVDTRLMEVRNSVDGLWDDATNTGVGFYPRNIAGQQAAGQSLVTSQINVSFNDGTIAAADVNGVDVRIPIVGGTDQIGTGGNVANFNANIASNNAAVPDGSHFLSIADAEVTASTGADNTTGDLLLHLGYWQTDGLADADVDTRKANGNTCFVRHGNETEIFFSRYGHETGRSETMDLTGINVKNFDFGLAVDASVTGIPEPANADINFTEGDGGVVNLDILTINADRTIDECWGAIHSFQVTETVEGAGRNNFNQEIDGTNIDVGGRSVEIARAGGVGAGIGLTVDRANDRYTGFSNMVNHRAEGTITYDIEQTGFTFFDTGVTPPTIVIDGGTVDGTLRLPPGNYTIQNAEVGNLVVVRDPAHATGTVTLTLTNITTNDGDIDVTDPNVNITVTVIFDGGAPGVTGFQSRIQLYPLAAGDDLAVAGADNVLDVTGDPGLGATYPLSIASSNADYAAALVQGARFVMVYTRPGFDNIRQVIGPMVAGENNVTFTPVANVLANASAATQLVGATMTSTYNRTETPGRIEYTLSQGPGNPPTNVQTNNLFEQAKSSVGVGEFVAKNDFIQPIQHTNSTNTYLFSDDVDTDEDFRLIGARDGALIQHNIGFVGTIDNVGNSGSNPVGPAKIADINSTVDGVLTAVDEDSIYEVVSVIDVDWSAFATQGNAPGGAAANNVAVGDIIWVTDDQDLTAFGTVQLRARLESVLLGQQVDAATYGDVDSIVTANRNAVLGNMQAQTTQIREIVSEELAEGTLTNIGRT